MTKRMLIDSTHAEETRVVVLENNRLEDFDVETSTKKQLKGNIYLAKVVRVEPSLQAAFVEFGGGRHGFLAFGEIHPDYYQIPVADRRRLMELQEAEAREDEEAEEREAAQAARGPDRGPERGSERGQERGRRRGRGHARDAQPSEAREGEAQESEALIDSAPGDAHAEHGGEHGASDAPVDVSADATHAVQADPEGTEVEPGTPRPAQPAAIAQDVIVAPHEAEAIVSEPAPASDTASAAQDQASAETGADPAPEPVAPAHDLADGPEPVAGQGADVHASEEHTSEDHAGEDRAGEDHAGEDQAGEELAAPPESVGGEEEEADEREERAERRGPPRFLRNYKIQEVIRRRQIMLIQVVKEERGTKGAALTTYISLAGRFSVLMPNSPRGGGISRKITSATDRRRLKEDMTELDLPRGMGLIVRTAGANRPKPEILRDGEYLLNQWDQIRELTMKSMAPALIYEEASLIKRAIRDVYSRDVDDILVDGEEGWKAAHDFMRMLMPTHAKKVQLWKDPTPLFAKAQVEPQLDAMLLPTVQLRSGGYLVINQTEALVAIDVNSGRSTRERGIEETALRTNLEAAEETARQLRLRDLAGLIVIDFIDMESRRNNVAVEKRLKDSLRFDRARIQVGVISHFGLMEMSRQRLRPSLTETTFVTCTHCGGTGHVRSTETAALHVLRGIEEEGAKRRAAEIMVHVAGSIAFYILNHKRVRLAEVEQRFDLVVTFKPDDSLLPPEMRIEKIRAQTVMEGAAPVGQLAPPEPFEDPDEEIEAPENSGVDESLVLEATTAEPGPAPASPAQPGIAGVVAAEGSDDVDGRGRKRRRRRRGGRREEGSADLATESGTDAAPGADAATDSDTPLEGAPEPVTADVAEGAASSTEAPVAVDGEAAPAPALGEDGERKRRGRRGGRRRRRGEGGPDAAGSETGSEGDEPNAPTAPPAAVYAAPAYAPPAYVAPIYTPPVYSGPTPADPFGGANDFAFFDAVEQELEAAPMPAKRSTPAPAAAQTRKPEPVKTPEPAAQDKVAPPVAKTELPVAPAPEPPPIEAAAAEPGVPPVVVGPATIPVTIGGDDAPPAEKKRGWWRR